MLRLLTPLLILLLCTCVRAQNPLTYTHEDGEVHLAGPHELSDLQAVPYADWYAENAAQTLLPKERPAWATNLNDVSVRIFLGTWCGDSKTWVPRFVTLWESLGLDPDKLEFIALYDDDGRYKQGPAGEEKGMRIHRVPTFIFERDDAEIARIVERPRTDLLTDVAQIALGYPAQPRYPAANYLMDLFENTPADSVFANFRQHLLAIYRDVSTASELNTLGNVLAEAGQDAAAYGVFRMNATLFKTDDRALRQFAESAEKVGENRAALTGYELLLRYNPDDDGLLAKRDELRQLIPADGED